MSREALLPQMASYVLTNGLAGLSLRPLAKALGTSDRMLLYHFGNKDQLVRDLLQYLSELYASSLDAAFPKQAATSRKAAVEQVLSITDTPDYAPFQRVWWDLVAGAAAGDSVFRESAQTMLDVLLLWLENHMPADDPDPKGGAQLMFTIIEGALMLDTLGRRGIADEGISASDL